MLLGLNFLNYQTSVQKFKKFDLLVEQEFVGINVLLYLEGKIHRSHPDPRVRAHLTKLTV